MKKYVAICAALAALAWVGAAFADTPQGKLTGSATLAFTGPFAIGSAVIDGGTSYVGAENDLSGNCTGDSGTVVVNGFTFNVVCAHFVASSKCCNAGSPKMRFAFQSVFGPFVVVRMTDNGLTGDTFAFGGTDTLADAQAWVNRGARGSGSLFGWLWETVTSGDWTITASQT